MAQLVTLEQVDLALRLDLIRDGGSPEEYDDVRVPDIELKMDQAEAAVLRYLKGGADPDWTIETAPREVSAAIILGVKSLLDENGADMLSELNTGIPGPKNPICSLLYPLRDPALV